MKQIILLTAAVFLLLIFAAPVAASEWYLTDEHGIHPESAWNLLSSVDTSDEVIVAVLSTGIDYTHPDILPNIWNDTSGTHGTNIITSSADVMDTDGEGTHCAGVIASVINRENASNIKIMSVVIGTSSSIDISREVSGINYAVSQGANIICIPSGRYSYTKTEYDALKAAEDAGIICICAAGDDGRNLDTNPYYPAGYSLSNVMSIAASNSSGEIDAVYSNYGLVNVTLTAPGTEINAAYLQSKSAYKKLSGTAASAAITAGAAAVIKSINQTLSPAEIKTLLTANTDTLSTGSKPGGAGLLNLSKAALAASRGDIKPVRIEVNETKIPAYINATGNESVELNTVLYNRFGYVLENNVNYTIEPASFRAMIDTNNSFIPERNVSETRKETNVTITITAERNSSVSKAVNITVVNLYPASVHLTKKPVSSMKIGSEFSFAAEIRDQTETVLDGFAVNWTSSNTDVGTINETTGNFTAVSSGTTNVTASCISGAEDTYVVSVQKPESVSTPKSSGSKTTHERSILLTDDNDDEKSEEMTTKTPEPTETPRELPTVVPITRTTPAETPSPVFAVFSGICAALVLLVRRK